MIAALLVGVGLALLIIPGIFGPPLRLPASEWSRLAATALALGFIAVEVGLALWALPAVLRGLHAAGFAAICEPVLAPLAPGGDALGWVAGFLAVGVGSRAWRAGRRAHRQACAAEVEPWLGRHEDRGEFELVVLPTDQLLAVTVPAAQPQIVISDGLIARLNADQLEAVIRHEATHHHCSHWRFALLATSVERAFAPLPIATRSTRALRTAVEAWADEAAAGDSAAGRALIRRAIVTVAGSAACEESHGGALVQRTRRLEDARRSRALGLRLAIHAPVFVLGVTTFALLAGWMFGAQHAVAFIGHCRD